MVSGQLDLPPYRDDVPDGPGRQLPSSELDVRNILARLDFLGAERCSANVAAQWAYETDVNEYSQLQAVGLCKYAKNLCFIIKKI